MFTEPETLKRLMIEFSISYYTIFLEMLSIYWENRPDLFTNIMVNVDNIKFKELIPFKAN